MTRIELHIDRVVLDGIDVSPRHVGTVQEALHTELTRLITKAPPTSWQHSRYQRRVGAPTVRLSPSSAPEVVGHDIARSLYDGVVAPSAQGVAT